MRKSIGLAAVLALCALSCTKYEYTPTSTISIGMNGDDGVEFETEYVWSNDKTNHLSGVSHSTEDGSYIPKTYHNGIPDTVYITNLRVRSLSDSGSLGVTIAREPKEGPVVLFHSEASGENAKMVYNVR